MSIIGGTSGKYGSSLDNATGAVKISASESLELIPFTHDEHVSLRLRGVNNNGNDNDYDDDDISRNGSDDRFKSQLSLYPKISHRQFFVKAIVGKEGELIGTGGLDGTSFPCYS